MGNDMFFWNASICGPDPVLLVLEDGHFGFQWGWRQSVWQPRIRKRYLKTSEHVSGQTASEQRLLINLAASNLEALTMRIAQGKWYVCSKLERIRELSTLGSTSPSAERDYCDSPEADEKGYRLRKKIESNEFSAYAVHMDNAQCLLKQNMA